MSKSRFRSMHGRIHGIEFDSGYEKKFLNQCYQLGIKVQRCKIMVPYLADDGKWRHYNPDFYWPTYDYVIEIKGSWAFKTNHAWVKEKYHAAMARFNGRYTLLTEKELRTDFVHRLHLRLHNGD